MNRVSKWAVSAIVSLGAIACIQREPLVGKKETQGPSVKVAASAQPTAEANRPATGNYGKVAGVDLLGSQSVRAFKVNGKAERVDVDLIKVSYPDFNEAIRAKIKTPSANNWDVQIQARTTQPVAAGDVLLATFYFRTTWVAQESGEGQSEINLELSHDPWTKAKTYGFQASHEWQKFTVPFVSEHNFKAGDAQVVFRLGYAPETVEFAGIKVENFGKKLALADMPTTKVTYRGAEPQAAWRAAAAERIEKIRKGDLTVTVKDASGKPLPHAQVTVVLKKHAFGFGTAVPAKRLLDAGNDRYQQELVSMFNTVTLENDLKWVPLAKEWGGSYTIERAQQASDWLSKHGLALRGHVLVWPGWHNLPKYLRKFEKEPAKLKEETDKHIREVVSAMKGRVVHWDTLNEPFDNHDLLDILGKEVAVDWFKAAHQVDPAPKLFINDYSILSGGGGTTPHRDTYEAMIKLLVDKGAPLDGIGMQGHFGNSLTAPEDMLKILDRYAKFSKTIWITEFDIVMDDEALAGGFTRDFYTTLFSHPAIGGIVMWGFWDADHWKNNAPVYRKDWSLKPAGQAYRDLVLGEWRTNAKGETNDSGAYNTRGFLGEYEVTVTSGSKQKVVQASLVATGTQIGVAL